MTSLYQDIKIITRKERKKEKEKKGQGQFPWLRPNCNRMQKSTVLYYCTLTARTPCTRKKKGMKEGMRNGKRGKERKSRKSRQR